MHMHCTSNFSAVQNVSFGKSPRGTHEFACVQLHNTMMGRDIIRETSLEIFNTKDAEDLESGANFVSKDHQEIPDNISGCRSYGIPLTVP